MPTAEQALNLGRSFLGEGPRRFVDWYPAPIGTAWCCIFQSYVLSEVGIPTRYAWVSGLFDQYRREGRTFAPHEAQPGDLVAFDYDGNGPRSYDHIAMVESVTSEGIIAINGNWTNKVCRVLHRFNAGGFAGGIAEIARPEYISAPSPTGRNKKLFDFIRNNANLIVQFGIGYGAVVHRWQSVPNGGFGGWVPLHDGQPFGVDGVSAVCNADNRIDLVAWNSATNEVCYRTQNADGSWRAWRVE